MNDIEGGKTFLLGVGCQKGGTTWLFDYLSKSPVVRMPPVKELHIFDSLDLEFSRGKVSNLIRRSEEVRPDGRAYGPIQLRMAMLDDIDVYFNYFLDTLREDGVQLVADITPAYAALSPKRYRFIKRRFENAGVKVKVIFLMRDPVERAWSSVRMRLRNKRERDPDARMLERHNDESLLLKVHDKEGSLARTNYRATVKNLEKVFDSDSIYYGFYERLFNDESTRAICSFLGIPHIDADFDQRLNESPKSSPISTEASMAVATFHRDVYRFVEDRFGADFIRSIWPSARLLADEAPARRKRKKVAKGR